MNDLFDRIDLRITTWMSRYGVLLLRLSLGLVFFWFGILKFFPGMSPAQGLAIKTIQILTFGMVPDNIIIYGLATWEVLIGLGLLFGFAMRATLLLLFLQMMGTITPLMLFPHESFQIFPISPTLEGQYIIKNLVLISAGIVIGSTVRGGRIVPEPEAAKVATVKAS
jgi:uncharacterized membrane protein YphA (DoxX/SURF4 family)